VNRRVAFVLVTVLLDTIGFGLIMPVMPQLIVELTGEGLDRAAVYGGWLAFVYAALQFVCAPVLGNLSDRFGRRPVLLFAVGSLGFDFLIMGLAPSFAWLFAGRALAGIAGASFTPAYAYIADVTPPAQRAQQFGLIGAAFGGGFILGPAIGGLLGELGPRAPFFAAAALSLLNFAYGCFVLPESLPRESRRPFDWRRANPVGALLQVRRLRVVRGALVALFLWQVAHQVLPSTWSYYTMLRFGWTEALVGASFAFVGLVMAASQATLPRLLVPRIGEARAVMLGLGVGGLGYLGFGLATRGWMMFALLLTWFVGAVVMPATNALLSHRVPPDTQGELQGSIASLYSLSTIVGPPLMTQLFGRFAGPHAHVHVPGAAFLFAFVLSGLSLGVFRLAVGPALAQAGAERLAQPAPGGRRTADVSRGGSALD
jgi:DHA1 family tetracycline resistance protein-like MFS transporter